MKKYPMKVPNLVTKPIQNFYATAISFDVKILRYRTVFTDSTWKMEYYNGFIIIAGENIKVLFFLELKKKIDSMKPLVGLTSHFWLLFVVPAYITGIFWDLI